MSKDICVIYDKATSKILEIRNANGRKTSRYYGFGAAKAALTRFHKKWLKENNFLVSNDGPMFDYNIAEIQFYSRNIERTVKRKNLMTGQEFEESINTPYYCSPSSETYWSM